MTLPEAADGSSRRVVQPAHRDVSIHSGRARDTRLIGSGPMAEDGPREGSTRPRPAGATRQGSGADTGWSIVGTMLSGLAVWGGAGWLLDRWLDTRVFAPVGIILGMAAAIYLVVKRFGAVDPSPGPRPGATTTRKGTGSTGTTSGGRRSRPGDDDRTQKGHT